MAKEDDGKKKKKRPKGKKKHRPPGDLQYHDDPIQVLEDRTDVWYCAGQLFKETHAIAEINLTPTKSGQALRGLCPLCERRFVSFLPAPPQIPGT